MNRSNLKTAVFQPDLPGLCTGYKGTCLFRENHDRSDIALSSGNIFLLADLNGAVYNRSPGVSAGRLRHTRMAAGHEQADMTVSATIRSPDKLPKSGILNQETGVKPGRTIICTQAIFSPAATAIMAGAGLPGSQAGVTGKPKGENATKRKPCLVRNRWIE